MAKYFPVSFHVMESRNVPKSTTEETIVSLSNSELQQDTNEDDEMTLEALDSHTPLPSDLQVNHHSTRSTNSSSANSENAAERNSNSVSTKRKGLTSQVSVRSELDEVDYDRLSQLSLHMVKDFRYYFQFPYLRLFFAYLVVFLNFLIYAEDPVAHSVKECSIPVIGNAFAFVCTRYPPNAWSLLKVVMWLLAIICGLIAGKSFHVFILNRFLRLKPFAGDQGSWMVMFLSTILCLFIFSWIYNAFLMAGGSSTEPYRISSLMGISNSIFMKVAATCTWLGDLFTAWMVTDVMLQEKLYPDWSVSIRGWWKKKYNRIILFWIVISVPTFIVVFIIGTDYIQYDSLNRGFLPSNELSRAFLASFILVFDLLIVMQDWDFPHFPTNFDVKLPGLNVVSIEFQVPKWIKKDWKIHITGKWFNYGIIFIVMLLDLNMWKNQIFYEPYDFGQYVGPKNQIHTVTNVTQIEMFNETFLNYEWRSSERVPWNPNVNYSSLDTNMNSRYIDFSLPVKGMAFIPSLAAFAVFGALIAIYGRFPISEKRKYFGRMKKRRLTTRRSSARVRSAKPSTENCPPIEETAEVESTNVRKVEPNDKGKDVKTDNGSNPNSTRKSQKSIDHKDGVGPSAEKRTKVSSKKNDRAKTSIV